MADAGPDRDTVPGMHPAGDAAAVGAETQVKTGTRQAMSARIARLEADLYLDYPGDRVKAAESLGELGQEAREVGDAENVAKAIAALRRRLDRRDSSGPARDAVTRALLLIGTADAQEAVTETASTRNGINKQAIATMMAGIQQEFDRHQIQVPVEADGSALTPGAAGGNTIHNGPIIYVNGDRTQLAWDNQAVSQVQDQGQQIAPGYEALAEAVAGILGQLLDVGLAEQDREDAEATVREILAEVTRHEPDRGKIRRAVSALKGFLAPLATGLMTGAGEGVQEWARTAIQHLGSSF